jgi:hypothetical protein
MVLALGDRLKAAAALECAASYGLAAAGEHVPGRVGAREEVYREDADASP